MVFYIASLETVNFYFQTFGKDTAEALELMRLAWIKHRRQYKASDTWSDVESDVQLREGQIGHAYRDWEDMKL